MAYNTQAKIKDRDATSPPGSAVLHDTYLIASGAADDWAGQAGNLGFRTHTTWSYKAATEGDMIWVEDEDLWIVYDGSTWRELAYREKNVATATTEYTATTANDYVRLDCTGEAVQVNLYTAVGNTGREIHFKKVDSSQNIATIDGNASETIDGSETAVLSIQYDAIKLVSNGTNWEIW